MQANFRWLIRFRWVALAGQALLVAWAAMWGDLSLPLLPLFAVVAINALFNALASALGARAASAVMLMDAAFLTVWLFLSGGPLNPFSTLYLVNVALAAVILTPRQAQVQLGFSLACFASLFWTQGALTELGLPIPSHHDLMRLHLLGMWVAFACAALSIVYLVERVNRALAAREAELAKARDVSARRERLAALATLAAGAAHELATPLGTIGLIAEDLEGVVTGSPAREDLATLRAQVMRCRAILESMAADAGQLTGEKLITLPLDACAVAATEQLQPWERERVTVVTSSATESTTVQVPERALATALSGLLRNALQASDAVVELRAGTRGERAFWEVVDRGTGMSGEVLRRAGEPFFTTKSPGQGMGLGLFLGRALAEQLGGELELDSTPGRGTVARFLVPAAGRLA